MKSGIDHVIHAAMRKNLEQFNVLYFPYDGWNEWMFNNTDIKAYTAKDALVYDWPCDDWPDNINMLPKGMLQIPNRIDLDAVVCNFRKDQVFQAEKIANIYHIPLILVDHELPNKSSNDNLRRYVHSRMPKQTIFVATHGIVVNEWKYPKEGCDAFVIPYGFVCERRALKSNDVLVIGDFSPEDRPLLNDMMNSDANVKGIGYNPRVTEPYSSFKEVENHLRTSRIVITASPETRPPMLALMAMAMGCVVITNKTRWTDTVIAHEENGMLFERSSDIKKIVKTLLNDHDLTRQLAGRGQEYIIDQFSPKKYVDSWTHLLRKVTKKVYIR